MGYPHVGSGDADVRRKGKIPKVLLTSATPRRYLSEKSNSSLFSLSSIATRCVVVIGPAGPFNVVFMNRVLHSRSRTNLHMIVELAFNIERGGVRNHLSFAQTVSNRIILGIIFNISEDYFL